MKVTVFTCTYNEPDLLLRAMRSVPRHPEIEYIVVNDGSTDGTESAVEVFRQRFYPEMIVYTHDRNMGLGASKNTVYDHARGDYLYELDHDDFLYPERFLEVLDELDGTDFVYVDIEVNDGSVWKLNEESMNVLVAGHTHFIRREFIGDLRTRTDVVTEDWFFNQDLIKKNPSVKFTNKIVHHYNFPREGSLLWNYNRKEKS